MYLSLLNEEQKSLFSNLAYNVAVSDENNKKTDQENLVDEISLGINADSLARHSDAGREFVKEYLTKTFQPYPIGISSIAGNTKPYSIGGVWAAPTNNLYAANA